MLNLRGVKKTHTKRDQNAVSRGGQYNLTILAWYFLEIFNKDTFDDIEKKLILNILFVSEAAFIRANKMNFPLVFSTIF